MPEVAADVPARELAQIGQHRDRAGREVGKSGMAAADHAPHQPSQHQNQHGVAGRLVQPFVVRREEGGGDQRHRPPMERPHEPIPDDDVVAVRLDVDHHTTRR